ncbi:hypothetical protein [Chitinophaga sancti]|uniref:hypothetical protein n=1 Tax=Chitinophaga sancti TaxID=1004 RepID=UPI003F7ADD6C
MKHYIGTLAVSAMLACTIPACTPESSTKELGSVPTASFTATPLTTNPNRVVVNSTTKGGFIWNWKVSSGEKSTTSSGEFDTLHFSYAGEYIVQLTVFTNGGYATTSQKLTIAKDAPKKDILNTTDWTILNTGGTQTTITNTNGTINFSNTGNTNGAIYQMVMVKANTPYILSANVKGNGATNSWLEMYCDTIAPVQGKDYGGTKYIAVNTWNGCGTIPFDYNIAEKGCDGKGVGQNGSMTFPKSDTVWVVIKGGSSGGTLGTGGMTLSNIQFLEEQ